VDALKYVQQKLTYYGKIMEREQSKKFDDHTCFNALVSNQITTTLAVVLVELENIEAILKKENPQF
jgi:hypothetical protein